MGFDWVGPDLVFGGMTTLFIITGILSLKDAAAGGLDVAFDLQDYELFDQFRVAGWLCLQQRVLEVALSTLAWCCSFHLLLVFPALSAWRCFLQALLLAPTERRRSFQRESHCVTSQSMLGH